MTRSLFDTPKTFLTQKRKTHIKVKTLRESDYDAWLKAQTAPVKKQAKDEGFDPQGKQILILRNISGNITEIIAGVKDSLSLYDTAKAADAISKALSGDFLKTASFEISGLKGKDFTLGAIGWALACYRHEAYKKKKAPQPALFLPASADKKRILSFAESLTLLRNLINMPANDLGPAELEDVARKLAKQNKAGVKIIQGKTLEKEFPLIHAVGNSSPRAPRLIDLCWGKESHPKLTLVGKGVCFDTGGLDLKPSAPMALMKKDMGGAAHVLCLAKLIIERNLPVRLRVLVPAVENAVSGSAYRPGDVFTSRKGIRVENTDTDAEGRLILADALTLASEEKPDLIIDFATLTGSARAALGPEIPAMFSNQEKIGASLQKISLKAEDPLWQMPLWQGYRKYLESATAEIHNSVGIPGDLIYSALFLESFLIGKPRWVHIDCFAWEQTGKPGRPKGAADTGLRAVFSFLEERYG